MHLSPEGKALWVAFYNAWAAEQAAVDGAVAAAFAKLEGYAARFALIHHVVTHVGLETSDLRPVTAASVEAGIALCRWFANETVRVYSILAETNEETDERRLVEFIRGRGGRITARELMRANCRRYATHDIAEATLDALVEAGIARWVEVPAKKKGRPGKAAELVAPAEAKDAGDGPDDAEDGSGPDDPPHDTDDGPHDTVPPTAPPAPAVSLDETDRDGLRQPVSITVMRVMPSYREKEGEQGAGGDGVSYTVVTDPSGLHTVALAVEESALVALDVETTGLDRRADRVRLLSLSVETTDGGRYAYLVDCFAVDPSPLWEALSGARLVIHNAVFDLAFLARMGFTPAAPVDDTILLARLLVAGTYDKVGLGECCKRWLGRDVDKAGQKSDWSGALTPEQLEYAALDVEVLPPLLAAIRADLAKAGLARATSIESRCLPAMVWMGCAGVGLDRVSWQRQAWAAEGEAARLRKELDDACPLRPGELFETGRNWGSNPEVAAALALVGHPVESTGDEVLAKIDHPLARLIREYRKASKHVGSFGSGWLAHVREDGRIYPDWKQMGSRAGRMSCGDPNMQQVPRGDARKCIVAPEGRVLVKADYSQIELRIAAKVSGDKAMLAAYERGEDLHALTARGVLKSADVTKADRQLAKALNFGLLYGMGAKTFREYAKTNYGLELSLKQASAFRDAFFAAYPGLAAWHRKTGRTGKDAIETRTLAGRRRLGVCSFTEKLNTPVQGTGADGLKVALALLWERRADCPGAVPVLAVHDEIVVEVDAAQAGAAGDWLRKAMVEGMAPLIEPVPVEVEVTTGRTWGG